MSVDMEKYFINPYNFVRYSQNMKVDSVAMGDDRKRGVISCGLKVVTPLSIPDTDPRAKKSDYKGCPGHTAYPFFSIDVKPVIPGSELRGLIRNVYETITDSCFSVINNNILSARSTKRSDPGLLFYDAKNDEWVLKKATKEVAHTENEKAELDEKYANCQDAVKRSWMLGVQLQSKKGSDKLINYSVFIPKDRVKVNKDELKTAVDNLYTILDLYYEYSDRDEEKKRDYFDKARPSKDGKQTPVFYSIYKNGRIILTPAQFSRKIYRNKVSDLLGDYEKCKKADSLCPACSLFGAVLENDVAVSSRVRFSDATAISAPCTPDYVPLKILSSPKPTCHEFYATKDYDEADAMLRGRKFYLHDPKAKTSEDPYRQRLEENATDKSRKEHSDLNASVQLINEGTFKFKIYFDGISENELKNLILSLDLGENSEDGKYMHKLGHGKPLGLGSVKIWVKEVKFRTIVENTYTLAQNEEFNRFLDMLATGSDDGNPLAVKAKIPSAIAEKQKGVKTDYIFADEDTLRDLLYICDFEHCKDFTVSYPIITGGGNVNDTASHRFFSWIRESSSFSNESPRSEKGKEYSTLPCAGESADAMKLPILTVRGNEVVAVDDALNATPSVTKKDDKKETPDKKDKKADDQSKKVQCRDCKKLFTPSPNYKGNYPCCPECLKKERALGESREKSKGENRAMFVNYSNHL